MRIILACNLLLLGLFGATSTSAKNNDAPHPQVAAALAWQMPQSSCGDEPKSFAQHKKTNDETGLDLSVSDTDQYTLRRQNRKVKRWEKCIAKHKALLSSEFETLKNSAQYGLTKPQADIILGNMKTIQLALMARDANPANGDLASRSND